MAGLTGRLAQLERRWSAERPADPAQAYRDRLTEWQERWWAMVERLVTTGPATSGYPSRIATAVEVFDGLRWHPWEE